MGIDINTLMKVLSVQGLSGEEQAIAHFVESELRELGVPAEWIRYDQAQAQSEYEGQTGNLIVRIPGKGAHPEPSRLFMAHLDSVPLCRGAQPVRVSADQEGPDRIVNTNPSSALGGDCRTGVAMLLHLARTLMFSKSHPPVWLVFPVQEEIGLIGARGLDLSTFIPDPPVMAFNLDSSYVNTVVTAVTGTTRFIIDIYGKAVHAGMNPERGVSAVAVASVAIAELIQGGWHGLIVHPEGRGSANVGIIQGGEMTNTVMDRLTIRGEVRSHDSAFRAKMVSLYRATFERVASEAKNVDGVTARVEWSLGPCYESFSIPVEAPVVKAALSAMAKLGITPCLDSQNNGGSDANWVNARGLPMVVLGTGMRAVHTVKEWIHLDDFLMSCRLVDMIAVE